MDKGFHSRLLSASISLFPSFSLSLCRSFERVFFVCRLQLIWAKCIPKMNHMWNINIALSCYRNTFCRIFFEFRVRNSASHSSGITVDLYFGGRKTSVIIIWNHYCHGKRFETVQLSLKMNYLLFSCGNDSFGCYRFAELATFCTILNVFEKFWSAWDAAPFERQYGTVK